MKKDSILFLLRRFSFLSFVPEMKHRAPYMGSVCSAAELHSWPFGRFHRRSHIPSLISVIKKLHLTVRKSNIFRLTPVFSSRIGILFLRREGKY